MSTKRRTTHTSGKNHSHKSSTPPANKDSIVMYQQLKPRTKNQAEFIRTVSENDITICDSPAGVGKTSLAVGIALEHLRDGKITKIIIVRPTIEASKRGLGYLKGDLDDKLAPYMIPLFEQIDEYIGKSKREYLVTKEIIKVESLEFFRGRNLKNCYLIVDECQNATEKQLKMVMTRLCENSKVIILGDTDQTDLPHSEGGALDKCIEVLDGVEGVGICYMDYSDIQRLPIVKRVLEAFERSED